MTNLEEAKADAKTFQKMLDDLIKITVQSYEEKHAGLTLDVNVEQLEVRCGEIKRIKGFKATVKPVMK